MAGSVNKVILIGNLGADPDVRTTPSGQSVATLSIATSETFNNRDGQRQERTEWHRVIVWGKLAELAQRYLGKGRKVFVEGRLQTRSWDDQQSGQKRYATEVVASELVFLDSGRDGAGGGGGFEERGAGGGYSGGGGGGGGGGGYAPRQNQQRSPAAAPAGRGGGGYQQPEPPPAEDPGYFDDEVPF